VASLIRESKNSSTVPCMIFSAAAVRLFGSLVEIVRIGILQLLHQLKPFP
jgi:hypothetical protein